MTLTPRGDRGADRQAARMQVGAVAEVLEHVPALRERRLADPVGALAAHLRPAFGVAVHPLRHVVAADAGVGARALGHDGRGVVRAARAEIGDARRPPRRCRLVALELLQSSSTRALQVLAAARRRGSGARRPRSRSRSAPARPSPGTASALVVGLVALADHDRAVLGVIELLLDLRLDQRALLLDDDDEVEALGEAAAGLPARAATGMPTL